MMKHAQWLTAFLLIAVAAGCSKPSTNAPSAGPGARTPPSAETPGTAPVSPQPRKKRSEEQLYRKGSTPEQQRYMEAGKPFLRAAAKKDIAGMYACLSSHARAKMNMAQFRTTMDDAERERWIAQVYTDVTEAQFGALFGEAIKQFGEPEEPRLLYCLYTDPRILAGNGDPIETAFAIGRMPESTPFNIRRASLRGQVAVKWRPGEASRLAESTGRTEAEVLNDDESQPYMSMTLVVVEEDGELRIGYFHFTPPALID